MCGSRRQAWILGPVGSDSSWLTSCVALGKESNLSEPQVLSQYMWILAS